MIKKTRTSDVRVETNHSLKNHFIKKALSSDKLKGSGIAF
jgi:hypothetical protein